MRLIMNSQMAKIGMDIEKPELTYQTQKPQLDLDIEHPQIEITNEAATIDIDQEESFAEANLKSVMRLIKESTQRSRQKMFQNIGEMASQGNELADIQHSKGVDMIAEQAERNAFDEYVSFNIDFIPKTLPKTTVQKGVFDVQLKRGQITGEFQPAQIDYNFNRGKVNIYLRQKNQLEIDVTNDNSINLLV